MKKISFSGAMLVALVMSLLGATPAAAGWAPRVVDTSTTFLGIAFTADGQKGLAVGTGGVFAMTFDGGKTWGPVALPAYPNDLQDVVYLPGTTTAVVVGNNGTILKFTLNADQSGYSISNLSIKTAEIFNSVAFGDTQSGWVVSNGGVIYHTANGGQAWVDAMSPDAQPVKRVRAINAARAWGAGGYGSVIFASNVDNWQFKTSGVNSNITVTFNDVAIVGSTLWAVGEDNTILKSTDSGTNWHKLTNLPVTAGTTYLRVRAVDANNVYISGTKGVFLYSTDGGANWHDFSAPATNYLYGLAYVKANLQFVAGSNSQIMAYDSGKPSAPTNLAVSPAGATIANNTPTISWGAASDAETGVASYEMRVNDGAYVDIGKVLFKTIAPVADGQVTIYVRAKDEGGNVSDPVIAIFTVKTATAPVVQPVVPAPVAPVAPPATPAVLSGNTTSGSLVKLECPRGASVSDPCRAVYFVGADNKRHAFPNDKVYFTWYQDFSSVQTVSAATMASLTLGKNIVYRPGMKMVKFVTDPKVYVVAKGGVLRPIPSEAVAKDLYGATWAKKIDDLNDAFFGDYSFGAEVSALNGFNPAAESTAVWNVLQN